jgi:hypothetical protein
VGGDQDQGAVAPVDHVGQSGDPAWVIADPGRARLIRAVAARQAIWGNHAYEALHPSTHVDADGQPLSGAHRYALHFDTPARWRRSGR